MAFLRDDKMTPKTRDLLLNTPFEHTLIDSENEAFGKEGPVVINTFGCPENDHPDEIQKVGNLAKDAGRDAALNVLLGDNGVTDKNSFKELFHNVHDKVTLVLLGNHDQSKVKSETVNVERKLPNGETKKIAVEIFKFDEQTALDQILHTFVDVDDSKDGWDHHKIKCWLEYKEGDLAPTRKKVVDLADLRKSKNNWNMPGRYGVFHCGHTDLFVLDTTQFVKDFINYYILKTDQNPNNQAAWFFETVKNSKAIHKVVLAHHPFHDISKRNIFSDRPDYLSDSQLKLLAELGIKGTYGEILSQLMFLTNDPEKGLPAGPGPWINKAITAHHHAINYIKAGTQSAPSRDSKETKEFKDLKDAATPAVQESKENKFPTQPSSLETKEILPIKTDGLLSQDSKENKTSEMKKSPLETSIGQFDEECCSGGAGGPEQQRHHFKKPAEVLFHSTDHGFVQFNLSVDGQSTATVNTLGKHCVQIVNGEIKKEKREKKIATLEDTFIKACQEFQTYLSKNPLYNTEKPAETLQPTYLYTGKAFDWVPNFYKYSNEIQAFLNHSKGHPQNEIEAYLKRVLTLCDIDPKTQYEAEATYKQRFVLSIPTHYFKTLRKQQIQWKAILETSLLTIFGCTYDDFIKPSRKPQALFLDAPGLTTLSDKADEAENKINSSIVNADKSGLSEVKISTSLKSESVSKTEPQEGLGSPKSDPLASYVIIKEGQTLHSPQPNKGLLSRQLTEKKSSSPSQASNRKEEKIKQVELATISQPIGTTQTIDPSKASPHAAPGAVRGFFGYVYGFFASSSTKGVAQPEKKSATPPPVSDHTTANPSLPSLKRASSAPLLTNEMTKSAPRAIPKPKKPSSKGTLSQLHFQAKRGSSCGVEARTQLGNAVKQELNNALSISV